MATRSIFLYPITVIGSSMVAFNYSIIDISRSSPLNNVEKGWEEGGRGEGVCRYGMRPM